MRGTAGIWCRYSGAGLPPTPCLQLRNFALCTCPSPASEQAINLCTPGLSSPAADFFRALAAAGVSRRRSAVPASQRGSQAWFAQQSASPAPLLPVRGAAGSAAEQQAAAAERTWAKADRYYFASMARLQRLWEVRCCCVDLLSFRLGVRTATAACFADVKLPALLWLFLPALQRQQLRRCSRACMSHPVCSATAPCLQAAKQPHSDLSGAEVEGSVRSVEHLLWLTQHSRAVLGAAGECYGQLSALHAALCTLTGAAAAGGAEPAAASLVPPQARCWAWLQQQRSSLAALVQQAEETAELLEAAAAAETAATPRKQLQAGGQQAAAAAAALRECSSRLGAASQQAVPLCAADGSGAGPTLFLPAAVLAALHANTAALQTVEEQLCSAAVQQEQQAAVPGWRDLVAAVAAARQESAAAQAALGAGGESAGPAQQQEQQLAASLEAAVAAALVWAQNAKPAEADAPAEGQDKQQEAEQPPLLPVVLQQLEQRLCLPKAAELANHSGSVLAGVAAASNLPRGEAAAVVQQQLSAAAAGLAPLLGLLLASLRQLGLQYLALHKAAAKLCYICASLFAGLVQEGFCMPEGTEGAAREE